LIWLPKDRIATLQLIYYFTILFGHVVKTVTVTLQCEYYVRLYKQP